LDSQKIRDIERANQEGHLYLKSLLVPPRDGGGRRMDFGSRQGILTNGSAVFIDCANERKKEE